MAQETEYPIPFLEIFLDKKPAISEAEAAALPPYSSLIEHGQKCRWNATIVIQRINEYQWDMIPIGE